MMLFADASFEKKDFREAPLEKADFCGTSG